MNEPAGAMPDHIRQALLDYRPPAGGYDEFLGADGSVRPRWAPLLEQPLTQPPAAEIDVARPWPLDAFPYVADPGEWEVIERGLLQRARLLNAIVADCYGPRQLARQQGLPPALLFANPAYLPQCHGYRAPDGVFLNLLAFDLGRSPDGMWRVLASRTETPVGLGFALENRIDTARLLPDLLERMRIARLARFYGNFADRLHGPGADAEDGAAVILSGGPGQPGHAEHGYLGQYLGYFVVEGADLTVRAGQVLLKTLEGLKPVRAIVRLVESPGCDPLELSPAAWRGTNPDPWAPAPRPPDGNSAGTRPVPSGSAPRGQGGPWQGTPGLLAAAAGGQVTIGNAIGSGVVENPALCGFLPGLCTALFDEGLILPDLATWWCGQDREARHVLANLENLIPGPAFAPAPSIEEDFCGPLLAQQVAGDADSLQQAIERQPFAVVAREPIQLSTVPWWAGRDRLQPAPLTLRLFVAATADGYRMMPGGLARIATPGGNLSKDIWVAGDHGPPRLSAGRPNRVTRRGDRNLPSRSGDDLYWLGRYLERSESAVRTYRGLFHYIAEGGDENPVELDILAGVLVNSGVLSAHRARRAVQAGRQAVERELWQILFDPESEDGLARLLGRVQRTADRVRERLSRDAWRVFDRLAETRHLRWRVHTVGDAMHLLDDLLVRLAAISGQVMENMTRNHGWRLLDLGKRIERMRQAARVIGELCTGNPEPDAGRLHLLLQIQDSTLTYRSRYRSTLHLPGVLDLLLLDATNPRSVVFQAECIYRHLEHLPQEDRSGGLSASERTASKVIDELALADPDRLARPDGERGGREHLHGLLTRTTQAAIDLSAQIGKTYFEHSPTAGGERR